MVSKAVFLFKTNVFKRNIDFLLSMLWYDELSLLAYINKVIKSGL